MITYLKSFKALGHMGVYHKNKTDFYVRIRSKLVRLSKPVDVTENIKDASLPQSVHFL
jgi:hypothetical protein